MKKLIALVILYSFLWLLWTFLILCPSTNAQWEGAEVQRLTYNSSFNRMEGLYINEDDKLFLFYHQCKWDPQIQPSRDTILLMTKEKNGEWSPPEKIGNSSLDIQTGKYLGYDTNTEIIHIVYSTLSGNVYDDTLYYTNSTIPDWEVVKIDSLPGAQWHARYRSLNMDFDSLGNVHLVWHLEFDSISYSWYRVMYANNSTGEWIKQQVSPPIFLGYMGSGPSYFDVQKNGAAHIIYWTMTSSFYTQNDSLNSPNWTTDTLPKPSRPLWQYRVGHIKVDANDRVHLFTCGCIEEYCVWPGLHREFYYSKQAEDSLWIGPDLVLDSLFYPAARFIDSESVPYLTEWDPFTYCWFFTDRKQGFWREPYQIFDTVSNCCAFSVLRPKEPFFVLDSEGRGHAVFAGALFEFAAQDDSLEIYYHGTPFTSVEDTLEDQRRFSFELFQNYPNPFNAVTRVQYAVGSPKDLSDRQSPELYGSGQSHPIHTTLKIYNILGQKVRTLVDEPKRAGNYEVIWDGKDDSGKEVSSGIYFYQLTVRQAHRPEQSRGKAGDYKQTRKLILIK